MAAPLPVGRFRPPSCPCEASAARHVRVVHGSPLPLPNVLDAVMPEVHVRCSAVHAPSERKSAPFVLEFETPEEAQVAAARLHGRVVGALGPRALKAAVAVEHRVAAAQPHPDAGAVCHVDAAGLGVPGVGLVENFVDASEESALLAVVDASPWEPLSKRFVKHFGYAFRYATSDVASKPDRPWPDHVSRLAGRIGVLCRSGAARAASFGLGRANAMSVSYDQCTANDYPRGIGIAQHVDTPRAFGPTLASVSLASDCVFELSLDEGAPGFGNFTRRRDHGVRERRRLFVPRRSLLLLSGPARYCWAHGVPSRRVDDVNGRAVSRGRRVSLTFRDVACRA